MAYLTRAQTAKHNATAANSVRKHLQVVQLNVPSSQRSARTYGRYVFNREGRTWWLLLSDVAGLRLSRLTVIWLLTNDSVTRLKNNHPGHQRCFTMVISPRTRPHTHYASSYVVRTTVDGLLSRPSRNTHTMHSLQRHLTNLKAVILNLRGF